MEEVERVAVALWRTLQTRLEAAYQPWRLVARLGGRVSSALSHSPDRRRKPADYGSTMWEWFFAAPSPHGCLSFLDDVSSDDAAGTDDIVRALDPVADGATTEQMEEEEVAEAKQKHQDTSRRDSEDDDVAEVKKHIFTTMAGYVLGSGPSPSLDVRLLMRRRKMARATLQSDPQSSIYGLLREALLVATKDEDTHESLRELLHPSDEDLTQEVVLFLAEIKAPLGMVTGIGVHNMLVDHPDEQLRKSILRMLPHMFHHIYSPEDFQVFFQTLRVVCLQDSSNGVRKAAFKHMAAVASVLPAKETISLALLGCKDMDPLVATAATVLIVTVLHTHSASRQLDLADSPIPALLATLATNIMWPYVSPSLLSLCLTYVSNLALYRHHLPTLPLEVRDALLRRLKAIHPQEATDKHQDIIECRTYAPLRQATERCLAELCRSTVPSWHTELLLIIKSRLDHNAPWQLRESGVYMLSVICNSVGDDKALDIVWPHLPFLHQCLYDSGKRVRIATYRTLLRTVLLWPTRSSEQREQSKILLSEVISLVDKEVNSEARTELLTELAKNMRRIRSTMDLNIFAKQALNGAIAIYPKQICTYQDKCLAVSVLNLLRAWLEHLSTEDEETDPIAEKLTHYMPNMMAILLSLPPNTSPDGFHHALTYCLRTIIAKSHAGGKALFEPFVGPTSILLEREIDRLVHMITTHTESDDRSAAAKVSEQPLARLLADETVGMYQCLAGCIRALVELLRCSYDVFSHVSPFSLAENMRSVAKMDQVETLSSYAMYVLNRLEDYSTASKETVTVQLDDSEQRGAALCSSP